MVSIIIPTYNRAHLIGETLDSFLEQTYQNWECIIVDDGSTDNTQELIDSYCKKDSRFRYYERPDMHLPGGNGARNYGYEMAKGDFINWFDDDDIALPHLLEKKLSFVTPELDLILSPPTRWNPIDNSKKTKSIRIEKSLYEDFLCWKIKINTSSILFRRSFLEGKELFSPKIRRGQDTELFLRMFYQLPEESFTIINEPFILYRRHSETIGVLGRTTYVPEFKESIFTIHYENYLRLMDSDLVDARAFSYRHLLGIFYESIDNKDFDLSKTIILKFFSLLRQQNYRYGTEMIIVGKLFIFFRTRAWWIINRWKKFDF